MKHHIFFSYFNHLFNRISRNFSANFSFQKSSILQLCRLKYFCHRRLIHRFFAAQKCDEYTPNVLFAFDHPIFVSMSVLLSPPFNGHLLEHVLF